MAQAAVHLVDSYGLAAVFLLMAAESCGLPFPSEVVMPLSGALAASGHLNLWAAILAGAVANLAGSLVAWWLADRFGHPLLLGPGRYVGISRRHLALAERWFGRYGLAAVFAGRLLPVVRTYISFPAGFARVPLGRFALLTFLGALPWSAALAVAGFELGARWEQVAKPIEAAAIVMALLVLIALAGWFLAGRRGGAETGPS
jgi:membrane protein DedA with SNARE-associated domain